MDNGCKGSQGFSIILLWPMSMSMSAILKALVAGTVMTTSIFKIQKGWLESLQVQEREIHVGNCSKN